MDSAIRWSVHSTAHDKQFLHVDVPGRSLRLYRITSSTLSNLTYETIATYSHVPAFRAFDWSPVNPALVAVGQSSGEATVLRMHEGPEARISFPLRSQRLCNAVALNTQDLLAVGLDKVRNDFCLNVWDLNQRVPNFTGGGTRALPGDKGQGEPYAKLASSEPITSIKFFNDQPQTLVTGVKAQNVRIYDLREGPGSAPSLQFTTRCVHNLAIDPCDENYIASCVPTNDPIISIWDRRVGGRSNVHTSSFSSSDSNPAVPSLELKNVADGQGSIWSLRFAKSKRSCLGMLTSTGQFKTFDFGREYIPEADVKEKNETWGKGWNEHQSEDIFVERTQEIERSSVSANASRKGDNQIVSFDFVSHDEEFNQPGVLSLTADGKIEISGVGRARRATSFSPFTSDTFPLISSDQKQQAPAAMASPAQSTAANEQLPQHLQKQSKARQSLDTMRLFRERCEKGYQFDGAKNRSIVRKDISLNSFWRNVQHATTIANASSVVDEHLDLSYLGVHSIWMDELGIPPPYTTRRVNPSEPAIPGLPKTTESLVTSLRLLPMTPSPQTSYLAPRRLCLYIAGLQRSPSNLETRVIKLSRTHPTEAAALALFASQSKLATRALRQKSSSETHKMLAMAIASSMSRQKRHNRQGSASSSDSEDSESEWSQTLSSLVSSLPPATEDPYAHAIIQTMIHGTPAHQMILSNPALPLPLKDKIFIAIHHLQDHDLTTYISRVTKSCIIHGNLEGIVLTGLATPSAISLLSNYITRTGDVQSVVLALTPVIPRYLSDPTTVRLFECWREEYRTQIMIWDLKFARVRFDVQGRKLAVSRTGVPLIPPAAKQISINCTYCQQSITQFPEPAKPGYTPPSQQDPTENSTHTPPAAGQNTTAGDNKPGPVPTTIQSRKSPRSNPLAASNKAAAIGTICPKCGRGLPRCGVCELPLGMPDSSYVKPLNNNSNHISQTPLTSVPTRNTARASAVSSEAGAGANGDGGGKRQSTLTNGSNGGTNVPNTTSAPANAAAGAATNTDKNSTNHQQQQNGGKKDYDDEVMAKFITLCISCNHGFHANHAREWFHERGHSECPVADCECICAV